MVQLQENKNLTTVVGKLVEIVGREYVHTEQAELEFYARDFSDVALATPAVIVQPASTEEVVEVTKISKSYGYALVPRGGGMSYTLGYVPQNSNSIVLDMRRMNQIIEINTEDLYITVETGVTWQQIYQATQDLGVRIPFFGTLSGMYATVGGGLAQNAVGQGSGHIVDWVLGLEVVLADGRVVATGAGAAKGNKPFLRYFGPDLTGLFLADCGAFGVKTKATFQLAPTPGGTAFSSVGFNDTNSLVAAECELARLGFVTQCNSFGRYHLEQFAAMGFEFLRGFEQVVNVVVDSHTQAIADQLIEVVNEVLTRHGGTILPNSVAVMSRAQPFFPISMLMLGAKGECSLPTNGVFPLSKALAVSAALDKFFTEKASFMAAHGISETRLYLITGSFLGIEPILYWQDSYTPLRQSIASPEQLQFFGNPPANPQARQAVTALRQELIGLFRQFGSAHHQIGKLYPYQAAFEGAATAQILTGIKNLLDPDKLMNPGALGF